MVTRREFLQQASAAGVTAATSAQATYSMLFLTRKVIPHLKQIGVSDQAIHAMTVENPRRFFGGA